MLQISGYGLRNTIGTRSYSCGDTSQSTGYGYFSASFLFTPHLPSIQWAPIFMSSSICAVTPVYCKTSIPKGVLSCRPASPAFSGSFPRLRLRHSPDTLRTVTEPIDTSTIQRYLFHFVNLRVSALFGSLAFASVCIVPALCF
jgi:hypothetical protein